MKTAKITAVNGVRTWTNPQGQVFYYHSIVLDNGDSGSVGSKEQSPSWLAVGSNFDYDIEGDKIKRVSQKPFGGGGGGGGSRGSNASFALSYAKDFAIAKMASNPAIDSNAIIAVASSFKKWLDENA
jgi:hypothetical protein